MMDARRRDREQIGLCGIEKAWSKSPTRIEWYVFNHLFINYNENINTELMKVLFTSQNLIICNCI